MGLWISKLFDVLSSFGGDGKEHRILMLGLDAAGKTTILYKVKLNENVTTIPTIGFNVETVTPCKGLTFTVWDVGGQVKIRQLWRHYYQNTEGLLYVVDSSDRERLAECREELEGILGTDEMRGVPVVVLANKQDLPDAASPAQLTDALGLRTFKGRDWFIQATCAVNGDGVYEAMDAMARFIKDNR